MVVVTLCMLSLGTAGLCHCSRSLLTSALSRWAAEPPMPLEVGFLLPPYLSPLLSPAPGGVLL